LESLALIKQITTTAKKAAKGLSVRLESIQRKTVGDIEIPKTMAKVREVWFERRPM